MEGGVGVVKVWFLCSEPPPSSYWVSLSCFKMSKCFILGMRRYGDLSIQYRYGGSQYVSWPSAIYRDTTLTFVIRVSYHVVSIFLYLTSFSYSFKKYFLCGRCLCKMLVEMDLYVDYSSLTVVKDGQKLSIEKMFLTFKLPQSSQTFNFLVIFYFAISSQFPRISNLTLYIVYYLMYCDLYC